MADIVRIGRDHLTTDGAAALSLRAVARDLGVVSSAVYRYVANRDELLTLLVVDAYSELADEVDAALTRDAGASPLRPRLGTARARPLRVALRQPRARLRRPRRPHDGARHARHRSTHRVADRPPRRVPHPAP